MKIAVVGLWHLGCVTAACLAAAGHDVTGVDFDEAVVAALREGRAPVFEPGLDDLIAESVAAGRLRVSIAADAVGSCDVVWIAYDTPVDDDDRADVEYVVSRIKRLLPHLSDGTLILISSQVPVGTSARVERLLTEERPHGRVTVAYSPENLRLGQALVAFQHPDRVVIGARDDGDRDRLTTMLEPFATRIEWMSVESAEMTKHAVNAFLATSVAFANELAILCEATGADAKDVERGLKSERRIGPRAYVSPGAAFAGGTLARDLMFLTELGRRADRPTRLLSAALESNDLHRRWAERRLQDELGDDLRGRRIAVWGLTYKPGTDTLRRSSAVEMCRRLVTRGVTICAHDPVVRALPQDLAGGIELVPSAVAALADASALVVATEWPEYKLVDASSVVAAMRQPCVLDAGRFLADSLGRDSRVRYATVGRGAA